MLFFGAKYEHCAVNNASHYTLRKDVKNKYLKRCSLSVHHLSGSLHEAGVPLKWSVIKDYISNTDEGEACLPHHFSTLEH